MSRLNVIAEHKVVSGVIVAVVTAAILARLGLADGGADGGGADSGGAAGGDSTLTASPGPPVLADFDLQVEVNPDEVAMGRGEPYFYWLPEDVRSLDPPPERCRDRRSWAFDEAGADADAVWAKLTVENNRDRQVRIDDMRIVVETDEATPGGSVAACPVGGASAEPYGLLVDLSSAPPVLQFREDPGEEFGDVPGFELDPGEQDAFVIYVMGRPDRLVSWRLVADVRSGGNTTELILPADDEEPMRIAGTLELPMFVWTGTEWEPWP